MYVGPAGFQSQILQDWQQAPRNTLDVRRLVARLQRREFDRNAIAIRHRLAIIAAQANHCRAIGLGVTCGVGHGAGAFAEHVERMPSVGVFAPRCALGGAADVVGEDELRTHVFQHLGGYVGYRC